MLERCAEVNAPVPAGAVSWREALAELAKSATAGAVKRPHGSDSDSDNDNAPKRPHAEPLTPISSDGSLQFCFSYASGNAARVEEAKENLEARGHRVFTGKDVRVAAEADWRKQWCIACREAQVVINSLSPAYDRSESCAEEWNFSTTSKEASSIINLVVGGRDTREQLLAVPLEEVANTGGMAIRMYFNAGGQALSVNDGDDIAEKILGAHQPSGALPS